MSAARLLLAGGRKLEFHCLRAPNMPEDRLRALWPADVPVVFEGPDQRYEAMRRCECLLAASGTATLETALAGVPTIVSYRVAPLSALVGRWLIKVPWVSLTNLIMNRELFPELLQDRATGEAMAGQLREWLDHPEQLERIRHDLNELRLRCGEPGSAGRAADKLLAALEEKPSPEGAGGCAR